MNWAVINKLDKIQYLWYTIKEGDYNELFKDKNDDLILVDYKTDYVEYGNEYELVEKYKEQLELYRIALEQALNRKVDKMCIYSLYLNNLYLHQ